MSEKLYYDLFSAGRWIGMSEGVDEDEAKRMAGRCLPTLCGMFTLVRWYGRNHPDNCKSSGGHKPDPVPEPLPLSREFARHLIDVTWGAANQDESVPSTSWADRIIDQAERSFQQQPLPSASR